MWIETFPALSEIEGLVHGFITRVESVDVDVERDEALHRLQDHHDTALARMGTERASLWTAEQVHGREVAHCRGRPADSPVSGVDGLITAERGVTLGIYVADCCAVFLVDTENQVCALLHSGKKGTEYGIVTESIEQMQREYGSRPESMIAQLSPCIRPPWYEIDFAQSIREQCLAGGLTENRIHDSGTCTAENVGRYYSYRREKGRTGRMLAVIGFSE